MVGPRQASLWCPAGAACQRLDQVSALLSHRSSTLNNTSPGGGPARRLHLVGRHSTSIRARASWSRVQPLDERRRQVYRPHPARRGAHPASAARLAPAALGTASAIPAERHVVDAHDPAPGIGQGAAGVAGSAGRPGWRPHGSAARSRAPPTGGPDCADDAPGRGVRLAQGMADREHDLAHAQCVRIAGSDGGRPSAATRRAARSRAGSWATSRGLVFFRPS